MQTVLTWQRMQQNRLTAHFFNGSLLASEGYSTTIKLEFLLEQPKSRNAFMSAVHKGKYVYRIKTLRLEIRFVLSLEANPRAWEKKGSTLSDKIHGRSVQ